jgi:2'-hydroxyisoflavone reductase
VRLLILGGPRFLGRGVADAALGRGHDVTFFNRGKTNPELYPDVERIVGDRAGDLAELRRRSWDAVIDTSGYLPSTVRSSAAALAECGLYCFVSSISVYADFSRTNDEDGPWASRGASCSSARRTRVAPCSSSPTSAATKGRRRADTTQRRHGRRCALASA